MRVRGWACALWLTLLLCAPAEGEVILHGFAQAGYAARITGAALPGGGGAFLGADERLQLSLSGAIPAGVGGFSAKVDFFHDAVAGTTGLDIREAHLDVGGGKIGARVGRQIITWGTGDLLFINDPFPQAIPRTSEEPRSDLGNTELALKVSGSLSGWDLALYTHRGYYRTPIMVPDATAVPPRLPMRYPPRHLHGGS